MESISKIRSINQPARSTKRSKTYSTAEIKKCPGGNCRDGFLRHQFKPFWESEFQNIVNVEADFFHSLKHICDAYKWPFPDVRQFEFPENIRHAYERLTKFAEKIEEIEIGIIQDENHFATVSIINSFNTGNNLYYIPIRPLWFALRNKNFEIFADLLTQIYCYLYNIVNVPFFTQGGYLDYIYEILMEWAYDTEDKDDDDMEWTKQQISEYSNLETGSSLILSKLVTGFDSEKFLYLLDVYKTTENWDSNFHEIAEGFYLLSKDYPKHSILDSNHPQLLYPQEEDRVYLEQYLSFFWSCNDCLNEELYSIVDNQIQEMGFQDEPLSIQFFDEKATIQTDCFAFESQFFELINQLCLILNDYDYERN